MTLTTKEQARVAELKQIGFEVVQSGIPSRLPRMTEVCYWRYMRGNRVSALHPHEDAAWRDCIKEWDETYPKANKSQGKTFEEAQVVSVLSLDKLPAIRDMKKALELGGYKFTPGGWLHVASGAGHYVAGGQEKAVNDAWRHAASIGINESDLLSVAVGYGMTEQRGELISKMFPSIKWEGVGQPPVGTTLWVTPHNTLWGFPEVGTYLCEVLAYRDDYVWLELLSDVGDTVYKFTTTRTDKVDVKVWRGNNDA